MSKKHLIKVSAIIFLILTLLSTEVTAYGKDVKEPFKAAVIEFNPQLNKLDKNVDELLAVTEEAFKNGAKLVVAPEMSTTGYYYKDREAIKPFVDTIPGKTTSKFSKLTKKYDAYIVFGMPEVDSKTDLYYNAAALVGPNGYVGKYRKTHQWETEEHWSVWGDLGVPVFNTDLGKIAINICMDSAYFESARLAALGGADILAFPTNSSAQSISALPARAQENGLYILSANRSNTERDFHMIGASAIWSPEGKKLAEAPFIKSKAEDVNDSTIIYATIDPLEFNNSNKLTLKNRRPELYKELMLYTSPWDYAKTEKSNEITAAAIQYQPILSNKDANKIKISKMIADAKERDSQLGLVVLPELSLTGPVEDKEISDIKALSEALDGPTSVYMAEIAKTNQISIVYGFIEQLKGKLYNSAVLIDKYGKLVGVYRKTHLSASDKKWASEGSNLPVFVSNDLGKIGILIGDDVQYPEAAGVLAVKRADIIAIPSAWYGQYGGDMEINENISANKYPKGSMTLWDSTAMSSQAYTITANFTGINKKYLGRSGFYTLDPLYGLDQPVVASSNDEEALIVHFNTIQKDWWFNQETLISSRRTPYYIPLIIK